jgi:hypothetical protein
MRDLPLPTFPFADLDLPWRLRAQLRATIRDKAPASLWAPFTLVVARALATRRSSDMPTVRTRWERA